MKSPLAALSIKQGNDERTKEWTSDNEYLKLEQVRTCSFFISLCKTYKIKPPKLVNAHLHKTPIESFSHAKTSSFIGENFLQNFAPIGAKKQHQIIVFLVII